MNHLAYHCLVRYDTTLSQRVSQKIFTLRAFASQPFSFSIQCLIRMLTHPPWARGKTVKQPQSVAMQLSNCKTDGFHPGCNLYVTTPCYTSGEPHIRISWCSVHTGGVGGNEPQFPKDFRPGNIACPQIPLVIRLHWATVFPLA